MKYKIRQPHCCRPPICLWLGRGQGHGKGLPITTVVAGMDRARQQGKQIGRSKSEIEGLDQALEMIATGELSIREAADLLNTSPRTVRRRMTAMEQIRCR